MTNPDKNAKATPSKLSFINEKDSSKETVDQEGYAKIDAEFEAAWERKQAKRDLARMAGEMTHHAVRLRK
jgi:hypothetical protein